MGRFLADEAALSEIVGALMLILIVALAATSLALFVQDQQDVRQEQETLEQEADLERLEIRRIVPTLAAGSQPPEWERLNFTVASITVLQTRVSSMTLNGDSVSEYTLERFDRDSKKWVSTPQDHTEPLPLEPREQVRVIVDLPAGLFSGAPILTTDAVVFEVQTERGNPFQGVFMPPTAVALIEIQTSDDGSGPVDHALLDGRLSDHPDEKGRIVEWEWTVDDGAASETHLGRLVRAFECDGTTTYDITLEVTDNHGMVGVDEIQGFSC